MFGTEFFPTPRSVAYKMMDKISQDARHFLEVEYLFRVLRMRMPT